MDEFHVCFDVLGHIYDPTSGEYKTPKGHHFIHKHAEDETRSLVDVCNEYVDHIFGPVHVTDWINAKIHGKNCDAFEINERTLISDFVKDYRCANPNDKMLLIVVNLHRSIYNKSIFWKSKVLNL